jgi:urease accessory protein
MQLILDNWHGVLNLVYSKPKLTTQITHAYSKAPLKIQRSFYPEKENICHSVILHTAGGIVGGDLLSQNIKLQTGAQTLITTAAASKIYRSNGKQARQNINIQLENSSYLEYLPQETIVFNSAVYRQNLRVEIVPGATWFGWEITRFGRSARGEKFLQGEWRSDTEVYQQGNPLWIDRQYLLGQENFDSSNGLAGKPVVGTLSFIGRSIEPEIITKARNCWLDREYSGEAGVTQLISGLVCRYRGNSTKEVKEWFIDVWQLLRLNYLGIPITKPRIWQK